jgi:hypothetical protein
MKLSDEIRELQRGKPECCIASLDNVLIMLSERGRLAGKSAKNKRRGNSEHYSKMAKKRWNK